MSLSDGQQLRLLLAAAGLALLIGTIRQVGRNATAYPPEEVRWMRRVVRGTAVFAAGMGGALLAALFADAWYPARWILLVCLAVAIAGGAFAGIGLFMRSWVRFQ